MVFLLSLTCRQLFQSSRPARQYTRFEYIGDDVGRSTIQSYFHHIISDIRFNMFFDFSKINSGDVSKFLAFESLVCSLAKLEHNSDKYEFQRIEGSGGDRGVDAFWRLDNNKMIAYQAKYFIKTSDIRWGQIDSSVKTCMKNFSDIIEYITVIACDLTPIGLDKWENLKKSWVKDYKGVKFSIWTKHEISDKLWKESAGYLRKQYFNMPNLNKAWFENHVTQSTLQLGSCFNQDKHVELDVMENIHIAICSDKAYEILTNKIKIILKKGKIFSYFAKNKNESYSKITNEYIQLRDNINDIKFDNNFISNYLIKFYELKFLLLRFQKIIEEATILLKSAEIYIWKIKNLYTQNEELIKLLQHGINKVILDRFLFISGTAGMGKSHLLGYIAKSCKDQDIPVLLIHGKNINNYVSLFNNFGSLIELNGYSFNEIIKSLNGVAKKQNKRSVIMIDAINEVEKLQMWDAAIRKLRYELKQNENITLILSCRKEYLDSVINEEIQKDIIIHEIEGFVTIRDQERACKMIYFTYGITIGDFGSLAEIFKIPLLLIISCIVLNRDIKTKHINFQFSNFINFINLFFSSMARKICYKLGYRDVDGIVEATQKTMSRIAEHMALNHTDFIKYEEANVITKRHFRFVPKLKTESWLQILCKNNLLSAINAPKGIMDKSSTSKVVRFCFQLFSDFLIADCHLSKITNIDQAFSKQGVLFFLLKDISRWSGLLLGISTLIPEKHNKELRDIIPINSKQDKKIIDYSFYHSLKFRSKETFSTTTKKIFFNELKNFSYTDYFYQNIFPDSDPLDAYSYHAYLSKMSMPQRDSFFCSQYFLVRNILHHEKNPMHLLIHRCINSQDLRFNTNEFRKVAILITWLFSASNKLLRNFSTKALVSLFIGNIDLFQFIAEHFSEISDIYIHERIYAAAFYACNFDSSERRLKAYSITTYNHIFKKHSVIPSILVREYAQRIIELCNKYNYLPKEMDFENCRPPHISEKINLDHSMNELNELATIAGGFDILISCTRENELFRNKAIYAQTNSFATTPKKKPNINPENTLFSQELLQIWVAIRAYKMGWSQSLFPNDHSFYQNIENFSPHSKGRDFGSNIDPIGRKYQWIALRELLARLCDNYMIISNSGKITRYEKPSDIDLIFDYDQKIFNNSNVL